ncbi:Unknown protein, partial [Striga hermonthica]
ATDVGGRENSVTTSSELGKQLPVFGFTGDEVLEVGVIECSLSLVGKIYGEKKVHFGGLKETLGTIWKTNKPFSARQLGQNLFQFIFKSKEDKQKILRGRSWNFDGQYLLLKEWTTSVSDCKEDEKVDTWIQIHNLPLHWVSHDTGLKIGRLFGKVLDVYVPDSGSIHGRIIKVLVELRLDEPILRGANINLGHESCWVDFRYEGLQTFCFYCGRIGHSERSCDKKKDDIVRNALKPGQFGEWLRASFGGLQGLRNKDSLGSSSPKTNTVSETSGSKLQVGHETGIGSDKLDSLKSSIMNKNIINESSPSAVNTTTNVRVNQEVVASEKNDAPPVTQTLVEVPVIHVKSSKIPHPGNSSGQQSLNKPIKNPSRSVRVIRKTPGDKMAVDGTSKIEDTPLNVN